MSPRLMIVEAGITAGDEQPILAARMPRESRLARSLLSARVQRDRLLGPDCIGEPAWNILLHLFVAREEGVEVTESHLRAEAGAPTEICARWIATLEAEGKLSRRRNTDDPEDPLIDLAPLAAQQLRELLSLYLRDQA